MSIDTFSTGFPTLNIDILDCDPGWAAEMLQQQDEVYQLVSKPRGRAIIINIETFDNTSAGASLPDRPGSMRDAINLEGLFTRLGFVTEMWDDVSKKV